MNCNEYKLNHSRFWNAKAVDNQFPSGYQEWYRHQRDCPSCQEWSRAEYCRIRGIDPSGHCCLWMAYYVAHPMETGHQGPNRVIDWVSSWDEYHIPMSYDGYRATRILFCPWCGIRLRDSKKELWYKALYQLGYTDPGGEEEIPEEFKSDLWWRKNGG